MIARGRGILHPGRADHRRDRRVMPRGVVPDKARADVRQLRVRLDAVGLDVELGSGAPALALCLHLALEALEIDVEAFVARDLLRQLEREAIRVVQHERLRAGDAVARRRFGKDLVQVRASALERLAELRLLRRQQPHHEVAALAQVRVGALHLLDHRIGHAVEQRRLGRAGELREVVHRPPQEPSQYIAAPLVRRHDAVRNQERARARVLRHDADRRIGRAVPAVRLARNLFDPLDDLAEDVGLVHRVLPLQDACDALQPRAGVDVLARQLGPRTVLGLVQRHEDEVPDLQEAAAVGLEVRFARARAARCARVARPAIDEDLAVRSARADVAAEPVVVLLGVAIDALLGHADRAPEVVRLVVRLEDRDPERVARQLEMLGEQLPGEADRPLLEVVADAEVAQHLEERQVAVVADGIDIRRPEALLNGGHARSGRLGQAHEVGLERHHAGACEEKRRVAVGHQRRARDVQVAVLHVELDEGLANLICVHGGIVGPGEPRT